MKGGESMSKAKLAREFARKHRDCPKAYLAKRIALEFKYTLPGAYNIIYTMNEEKRDYNFKRPRIKIQPPYDINTGEGLRKYLDQQEREEQEVLERKRLEKEHREKFQF